jgi:hypothetical protein
MFISELLSMGNQFTSHHSYYLLWAAALPPLTQLLLRNDRGGFFRRLFAHLPERRIKRK